MGAGTDFLRKQAPFCLVPLDISPVRGITCPYGIANQVFFAENLRAVEDTRPYGVAKQIHIAKNLGFERSREDFVRSKPTICPAPCAVSPSVKTFGFATR